MSELKKAGAPLGNTNNVKAKIWSDALRKHITQNPKDLAESAKALFNKAKEGDVAAMKEIGDRLEGKPTQQVDVGGQEGNPLITELIVKVIEAGS